MPGHNKGMDAAEAAFRTHGGEVYRYLLRRTGDRHEAEELTQAVFAEAVAVLPSLPAQPESMLGWLYTVAQRRFVDEIRRRSRRRKRVHLLYRREAEDPPSYGPSAVGAVMSAIDALPDDQRAVVVMRLFEDRSFADISRRLGTSEAACKMRFTRGLNRVRVELEHQGVGP